ncbi:uncharacterized protein (DUF2147 family) [Mucilaginibacter sp. UYP25]|uniref:DUF2147 domain-containing protein n=1 Tax=unclassified Mucilaginibacter TaxID=2617802 RepID=UPI003395869A
MANQFLCSFVALMLVGSVNHHTPAVETTAAAAEKVCGKWKLEDDRLIVQVYKEGNEFKAKIVWFDDHDDSKELDYWTDENNPNPAMRSRKLLGMNVLEKLTYNQESNSWEDGMIYDSKHGRLWNSSAYIDKEGTLKVKGYWHYKFIGKTLTFKRI